MKFSFVINEYEIETSFVILTFSFLSDAYTSSKKFLVNLNQIIKFKNYSIVIIDSQKNVKNIKNKIIIKCNRHDKSSIEIEERETQF